MHSPFFARAVAVWYEGRRITHCSSSRLIAHHFLGHCASKWAICASLYLMWNWSTHPIINPLGCFRGTPAHSQSARRHPPTTTHTQPQTHPHPHWPASQHPQVRPTPPEAKLLNTPPGLRIFQCYYYFVENFNQRRDLHIYEPTVEMPTPPH